METKPYSNPVVISDLNIILTQCISIWTNESDFKNVVDKIDNIQVLKEIYTSIIAKYTNANILKLVQIHRYFSINHPHLQSDSWKISTDLDVYFTS